VVLGKDKNSQGEIKKKSTIKKETLDSNLEFGTNVETHRQFSKQN